MKRKKKYRQYRRTSKEEDSYTNSGSAGVQDFKTIVIYGTLGIVTVGGLVFAANHFLKKWAKDKADNKSLTEGDPATYARELIMAFDNDNWFGWGTDLDRVYSVFDRIPTQAFYKKVQDAYEKETKGKNLNADLASELTSEEYSEVKRRLNSKR